MCESQRYERQIAALCGDPHAIDVDLPRFWRARDDWNAEWVRTNPGTSGDVCVVERCAWRCWGESGIEKTPLAAIRAAESSFHAQLLERGA